MRSSLSLDGLDVADSSETWEAAGFAVGLDGVCRVGGVGIRLLGSGHGRGIVGWSLTDADGRPVAAQVDGIPTTLADATGGELLQHLNGVVAVDHVVVLSPDLRRTVEVLRELGADPRRERDGVLGDQAIRQVFFRFGEVILEVVGAPDQAGEGPGTLWGITFVVDDIDATAAYFGERTSRVKDAVQPGRRITTLRHRDLGMSVRTALISAPDRA